MRQYSGRFRGGGSKGKGSPHIGQQTIMATTIFQNFSAESMTPPREWDPPSRISGSTTAINNYVYDGGPETH